MTPEPVPVARRALARYPVATGPEIEAASRDRRALLVLRAAVLVVCVAYTLVADDRQRTLPAIVGLVVVAVVGSLPPVSPLMVRWQPVLESVLAATVISLTDPLATGLLPYLLVPPLAAGLVSGVTSAVLASGLAGAVAIVGQLGTLFDDDLADSPFADVSLWVLLATGLGLFGAWVRRARAGETPSGDVAAYAAAYQLLEQLRTVSRQLSGGLDPTTVASGVADRVQAGLGGSGTIVVTRSERGVLVPLARSGPSPHTVEEALERHAAVVRWEAAEPSAVDGTVWVPLRVADRTVAMVVGGASRTDTTDPTTRAAGAAALAGTLHDDALRLETALLFDDVRSVATAEERRRLAREIHDGIAQELASLGYLVDGMLPDATDPQLAADLAQLRAEIRRVVGELRFSIYDLRSDVSGGVPLGDALSSYVREVGRRSDLIVHLVLDEAPRRLPAGTEAELLRIAQEAVTNARKHAQAHNLWVTCIVDPPHAQVQVADDGQGLGTARDDSYGLSIMAERAARIGAALVVEGRDGGGTVVDVRLEPDGGARPAPSDPRARHDVRPGEEVAR